MKKIKYFITILLLFLFISDVKAEEWKCIEWNDNGNTVYSWEKNYSENSDIFKNAKVSTNTARCSNMFDVYDTIECIYNYDLDKNIMIGADYDTDSEILSSIPITIKSSSNNNGSLNRSATYYNEFAGTYRNPTIKWDYFTGNGHFYCPKYIYISTSTDSIGMNICDVSTSKEMVSYDDGAGDVDCNVKALYKLTSQNAVPVNMSCYKCGKEYLWSKDMVSGSCYKIGATDYDSCVSMNNLCYEACANGEYDNNGNYESWGTGVCSLKYDKIKNQSYTYEFINEVEPYKCGLGFDKLNKTYCGSYKSDSFNSIDVYVSDEGAFAKTNSSSLPIYIRDSVQNTCPEGVLNIASTYTVSSKSGLYMTAGDDKYYVVYDSTNAIHRENLMKPGAAELYKKEEDITEEYIPDKYDRASLSCSVDHSEDLACGSLYFIPKEIPFFTNLIMNLIKIATPIILVIKGSIDLIKAITGGNEQEISKSRSKFFKRLIPAVLVFLIILVVQFIFGLFATDSENNTFLGCTNCFLNNDCSKTPQYLIDDFNNYCETGDGGQGSIANPPIASSGFNPNVKDKFSESNYNSKKITIPGTEKCRQNGNCVENIHEEGYIRVSDGVFYFPYDTSLNGNINGKGKGTEGINSIFEQRLNKFFAAARLAGYDISMIRNVGDGYRDIETQKFYYCCYTGEYLNSVRSCDGCDKKTCIGKGTCNNGSLASSPGTSPHGWGIAVDLNLYKLGGNTKYKDAIVWAHAHAEEYGLAFPVSNEDWHIEPLYVCDINGKSSKYGSCKRQKNYICKENKSILPNNEVGTGSSYCNP